MLIRLQ